jgi:hypothetical protein
MARTIPALLLLCLALPAASEEQPNEYSKSILYQDRGNPYGYLDKGSTEEEQQDAHCSELLRRMKELKGQPQRLSAVTKRFNAECKTRNGPRERAGLKDSGRLYESP